MTLRVGAHPAVHFVSQAALQGRTTRVHSTADGLGLPVSASFLLLYEDRRCEHAPGSPGTQARGFALHRCTNVWTVPTHRMDCPWPGATGPWPGPHSCARPPGRGLFSGLRGWVTLQACASGDTHVELTEPCPVLLRSGCAISRAGRPWD